MKLSSLLLVYLVPSLLQGASAELRPEILVMKAMSHKEEMETSKILGKDFVSDDGPFPPQLLSSGGDLDAEGADLKAVVQMAQCSNHSCTFAFLAFVDSKLKRVAQVDSWATPYLVYGPSQMKDIVYFDHLSNDCMACSPPTPVRLTWNERSKQYVFGGKIAKKDYYLYKMKWPRL